MRESYAQQAPTRVMKEKEQQAAAAARGAEIEAGQATDRVEQAWSLLRPLFPSMHDFLRKLLTTRHPVRSSQVSNLLTFHGHDLLNLIRDRHPSVANDWALSTARQLVSSECDSLSQRFKPAPGTPVSDILHRFSLREVLSDAEILAPTLFQILQQACGMLSTSQDQPSRKHPDLVLATTLCMLAKARNDHASDFPTTMCMYFLACGTSHSVFDVLNHAGVTLSYTQAVAKIKQLGRERLTMMREIARSRAFMVIWDNLNIAFKVSEQRHDAKDHFDNGTTATLLPLYDVDFGGLPLELLPSRDCRIPVLKFGAKDLLPTSEEAQRVEAGQLWHIQDILYEAFPSLRKRLKDKIPPAPTVLQIPVHKTEQYPLPAMHIDESSLEGTLGVLDKIIRVELGLTEDDIKKHGIILCAGDQLSKLLLDKVSAARRDDSDLVDNVGRYTKGQDGVFHMKMAGDRMTTNEHWGQPNSKAPWSLWKVNTLLGRKAIVAGWKAKSLPPFRPSYELILTMALPANILDGFRIYCPFTTIEEWVERVQTVEEVEGVAQQVLIELCSARRVQRLRRLTSTKRDVPLENICLFNRDALYLRQLKFGVKRGDVGAILDIATHWMLMFRGTGKMPKYADALFHILVDLKSMHPKLRTAWLMNWLANLTGKVDGFKEMDLLQEHQNFWAKIIYSARGSNRSWEWLAMVSVSIFALRDVIRRVQSEYKTPFNSTSHTSPSTEADLKILRDHLKDLKLQTYMPERENNQYASEVRDLLAVGAEYANKPSAFRNFTYTRRKATNLGTPEGSPPTDHVTQEDSEQVDFDLGSNGSDSLLDQDTAFDEFPFLFDDDEYPPGTNMGDYISMTREIIEELSHFE